MADEEDIKPTDSESKSADIQGHGDVVAKHYNQLQEAGRESRTDSRIYYMRNFNNWIKSVLIGETLQQIKKDKGKDCKISVLDLCSGKGGDLLKWKKGNIKSLVCADVAGTSVEQSEKRYNEMVDRERFKDHIFRSEFITADCSKTRLKDMYKDSEQCFDLCSCQFSFHYCFESLPQAEMMLQNAVECLRLGGYFIGTTPNSQELVCKLRNSDDMSFGNDVYKANFELKNKTEIPLFGAKYHFQLEGVVDCPEFLVYFPLLEKMAEKHGMKLIYKIPFADFFNKHFEDREYNFLLGRMQALEPFPPSEGSKLMGVEDKDYKDAQSFLQQKKKSDSREDNRHHEHQQRPQTVGTLSKAEWEAVTIYCVFMFQKVKDIQTGEEWQDTKMIIDSSSRKRQHEEESSPSQPKVLKHN